MITKTVKKLLRRLGVDLVKWNSGYQLVRFPGVGEDLSPLELIVPHLAATSDFYFVQIGANLCKSGRIRVFATIHCDL